MRVRGRHISVSSGPGWSTQQYSNEGGKEKREGTYSVSASMLIEAEIDLLPVSPGKGQKAACSLQPLSPGLANLPSFWSAFLSRCPYLGNDLVVQTPSEHL